MRDRLLLWRRFTESMAIVGAAYLTLFHRVRYKGRENLPAGAAILTPNHQSFYDGPLVGCRAPRPFFYLVSAPYLEIPLLGFLLRRCGCIPLGTRSRHAGHRAALEVLRRGEALVLFPEGRRSRDGRLLRLKNGAARLAVATGAPIVPVSLLGAFEAWPRHRILPRWCRPLVVEFHPPISPPEAPGLTETERANDLTAQVEQVLTRSLRAWDRLREPRAGKLPR